MLLREFSGRRAHIGNLFLIESINPKRFTLIVKSKNMPEKDRATNQRKEVKSRQT